MLEQHYNMFLERLYLEESFDNVNLKQAYLNSLPTLLGKKVLQNLNMAKVPFQQLLLDDFINKP